MTMVRYVRRRTATALLATVIALAACGGDDTPDADPDADRELLDDAMVTVDDLPEGFVAEPVDDADESTAIACFEQELDISVEAYEAARTAAATEQFESDAMSIRVRLNAFVDSEIPGSAIDSLDTDDMTDCVRDQFEEEAEEAGYSLLEIEVVEPLTGDEATAAYRIARLDLDGIGAESRSAVLLVDDRFVVQVDATGLEGNIDEDVIEELVELVADRIEAAD